MATYRRRHTRSTPLLVSLLLLAAANVPTLSSAAASPPTRPVILFLGDSITEFGHRPGGWMHTVQEWYGGRRADLVNRGYGGYSSRHLSFVLDAALDDFPPGRVKAAVLAVGSNDAKTPGTFGIELGVPLEEYKRNVKLLAKRLQQRGVASVVVATPPPAYEARRAAIAKERAAGNGGGPAGPAHGLPDRTSQRTRAYAEAARQAARELGGLPVADLFAAFEQAGAAASGPLSPSAAALFEADGLHLTPAGNAIVAGVMKAALRKTPWSAEALPSLMPWYADVDTRNPSKSFAGLYPPSAQGLIDEVGAPLAQAAATTAPAAPAAAAPSSSPQAAGGKENGGGQQKQQKQQQQQQSQQQNNNNKARNGGGKDAPPRKLGGNNKGR